MKKEYEELKKYMNESSKTIVVTGSGISYLFGMGRLKRSVGIMNARKIFSALYIKKHPDEFYSIMKNAFLDATFVKGPSRVHKQLAQLEKEGKIYGIVTQNLDCLHTIAGSENVVEFQGSFRDNVCIDCGARYDNYDIWNEGHMPQCEKCGGWLIPTVFCRNEKFVGNTVQKNMEKAINMISEADLVIVIGTTGFRSGEYMSRMRTETKLVQINPSETVFSSSADLNICEDAAEVLQQLI